MARRRTRRQHSDDELPDVSSKECYEVLLRTVDRNSDGPQPPAPARSSVFTIISDYGRLSGEQARRAEQVAFANGDLGKFSDPRDGRTRLVRLTEADLSATIEWLASLDTPDGGLIAQLAQAREEVAEDE